MGFVLVVMSAVERDDAVVVVQFAMHIATTTASARNAKQRNTFKHPVELSFGSALVTAQYRAA